MIDLHAHILHNLDDGPKTLEESLEMCRIAHRDGIRTIIATPHILNGIYETSWETILSRVHELNEALRECGIQCELRTPNSELIVLPGADVYFCSEILQFCERGMTGTVNNKGKYMMIELPQQEVPSKAEDLFFRLQAKGIIPIISHPERNMGIRQRPERYYQMVRMGCLGQVTAMSLTNGFGGSVRHLAEKLMSHRLVHFIASDAHSVDGRRPVLSSGVKAATKIVGEDEARRMVAEYPQAVLEGRRPEVPDPIPF
jgi:protein-tyrosine phosphatase